MFLQIQGIKKSFGTGDSRVDVLKGLDLEIERDVESNFEEETSDSN